MKQMTAKLKAKLARPGAMSGAATTALVIALIIALNAVIFALSEIFGLYIYKIDEVDLSLSDAPAEVFADAMAQGEEVTILFCQSEEDMKKDQTGRYVYETARRMAEAFPSFIHLEFENIVINPDRVAQYQNEEEGIYVAASSVIFLHGDNSRVLTTLNNAAGYIDFYTLNSAGRVIAYNGEEVMTSMILWVLADEHKTAYFTVGHSETADMTLTALLNNAGYHIRTIDLRQKEIPTDAGLLIISNPIQDFERAAAGSSVRTELARIEDYMERGGQVLAMLDPYMVPKLGVLTSFLDTYGISVATETTTDGRVVPQLVQDGVQSVTADGMSVVCDFADGPVADALAQTVRRSNDSRVLLSWTGRLQLDPSRGAQALLRASSSATVNAAGQTIDREGSYALIGYGERDHGEHTSRVIVIPSIYLATSEAMVSNGYANRDFLYALMEQLGTEQAMPYSCRTGLLTATTLENLTMGTARALTAALLAIPAALAVVGVAVVLRRKYR